MINTIRIKGLKCFDDETLYLKNFNILAGKNSVGKSTVIQAMLAVAQCSENHRPFSGKYIDLGTVRDLKNKLVGSEEIFIDINGSYQMTVPSDSNCELKGEDFLMDHSIRYVAADRVGVKETYKKNISDENQIGINCEYAFDYLAKHGQDNWENNELVYDFNEKLTFGGQVDYWLNKILGYTVRAEEIERTSLIRVSYGQREIGNDLSPKNVGTGVSYIAEIIIAALSCKEGDLLIVENPEIHLHPSGQTEFVTFLAFLAQKGIQIILETHSDHIYNGVRKCVHKDYVDNENVAIYFFDRKSDGCADPIRIELDDEGRVINPKEGLFDQTKKDLDVILGW